MTERERPPFGGKTSDAMVRFGRKQTAPSLGRGEISSTSLRSIV